MNNHLYILEPYKGMNTRYHCPALNCGNGKTFVRYINTETNEHIHSTVGRCNRSDNCCYHYTPKQYFTDNQHLFATNNKANFTTHSKRNEAKELKPVSFIPIDVFKASLKAYDTNHFIKFLIALFGVEVAKQLISLYFIGTSKKWIGATVFWQVDKYGKIRTGKIMLYSPTTGKRVKEPFSHIHWVHKAVKQPQFELKQCLFGEHLLIDTIKPVAIVESEKTAIIASVYLPQFIWLAAGNKDGLNPEKCSILKGRTVILFPDLNGFEKWTIKAKELSHLAIFTVSNLLESKATEAERKQGFDLADYLIKYDYKSFALPKPEAPTEPPPAVQTFVEVEPVINNEQCLPYANNWLTDITEIEAILKKNDHKTPIKLKNGGTIINLEKFIDAHLETVKANNGNKVFLPYLNRLQELKHKFINHKV